MSMYAGGIVRSMIRDVRSGNYKTPEKFMADYEKMLRDLEAGKEAALQALSKVVVCDHKWGAPMYNIRKGIIGSHYFFQRTCIKCWFKESASCSLMDSRPAWAKDAVETEATL